MGQLGRRLRLSTEEIISDLIKHRALFRVRPMPRAIDGLGGYLGEQGRDARTIRRL